MPTGSALWGSGCGKRTTWSSSVMSHQKASSHSCVLKVRTSHWKAADLQLISSWHCMVVSQSFPKANKVNWINAFLPPLHQPGVIYQPLLSPTLWSVLSVMGTIFVFTDHQWCKVNKPTKRLPTLLTSQRKGAAICNPDFGLHFHVFCTSRRGQRRDMLWCTTLTRQADRSKMASPGPGLWVFRAGGGSTGDREGERADGTIEWMHSAACIENSLLSLLVKTLWSCD